MSDVSLKLLSVAAPTAEALFAQVSVLAQEEASVIVAQDLAARFAGSKGDGITAAAVMLAAFTVYLTMSFFTGNPLQARPRPPAQGSPSAS